MSSAKLLISRFTCLTIPPGLNLTSFLESPVLLSLMPQKKSKRMHCKPKLRILRSETQITKLDTKMNQSGLNLMVMTCGCSWWLLMMVTIGVVVEACGGAMKGQWEERALGKRKKKWRRRRDSEERVRERRYLMRQVIQVSPILCLILQKCHWNSILKNWKHLFLVSYFHHSNSNFWVLSDGNKSWKSSQTRIFLWDPRVLRTQLWKLSDMIQNHPHPNKP